MAQHRTRDRIRNVAREVGQELREGIRQVGGSVRRASPRGGFGRRFVQTSAQFMQAPSSRVASRTPIHRRPPRKAGRGRVFFDSRGRPIAVSNAPNVRRIRRKARARSQQQDPFTPSFRFGI